MALNVALIGCGLNGRFHSTAIRAIARRGLLDINYAAVCDADPARASSFAQSTGATAVTDPREVIDSPDIDLVYICVPTAYHKDLVLRAAGRGKHVFCEKPLATNLADVEEMVQAVDRAGVKAAVGLVLRHSPILTVMKELMDDSTLGRLMTIVFRDDQFFPVQGHYGSEWRKDHRLVGSGTLLEHSIHDVDVLRWFGGEVRSVRGSVGNFAGHPHVEDLATGHLEFTGGGTAELVSVWHNVLSRPSTRRLELFFENGMFATDHDFFGPIQIQLGSEPARELSLEEVVRRYLDLVGLRGEQYEQALARYSLEDYFFLTALAEGAEPFPDFALALEAHRLVDAIYRSAAAGGGEVTLA